LMLGAWNFILLLLPFSFIVFLPHHASRKRFFITDKAAVR
jgi:hypothetical protein